MQWPWLRPVDVDIQHGTSHSSSIIRHPARQAVSTMIAPPVAGSAADITALFAEARRRRRRRRITAAAVSLAVAGSVMIGLISGGGHHDPAPRTAASPRR